MIFSTMPSTKYSCSGSPLMFWNGNTAIDGLSGSGSAAAGGVAGVSVLHPVDPDRLGDVLDLLLAQIVEAER